MSENQILEKIYTLLASETRLDIMKTLRTQNLRMQELARTVDITATEASRQLKRLTEVQLIQREPDGAYSLTYFGGLILQLSPAYSFIASHVDYFTDHDTTKVPRQFITRIGELSDSSLILDTIRSLTEGQRFFIDAEQYACGIAEGHIPGLMEPIMDTKVSQGLQVRMIVPENIPVGSQTAGNVQLRTLPEIPLILGVTEKGASVCFPFKDGRMDYAGFTGNDPEFHRWALDLFEVLWETAKPIY